MRRNQRGFTLMELMVVIVIVAILAAVAVPLYINYVRDAQRTEARGAIGAIITAEQSFFQRNGGTAYSGDIDELKTNGNLDITEAEANWTFQINGASATGFTVQASGIAGRPTEDLTVTYAFDRATGGTWTP